jgi:hypothetical protein
MAPGVDEDGRGRQEQSSGDKVVLGSTGLSDDQGVALEDDSSSDDGQVAPSIRAADAPGS